MSPHPSDPSRRYDRDRVTIKPPPWPWWCDPLLTPLLVAFAFLLLLLGWLLLADLPDPGP